MNKFLANLGHALMHSTQTVGEAFDVPSVEGALVSEYTPAHQALQQPLQKVLSRNEALNYLTDLWIGWARGNRVERFGQYVLNRTASRGINQPLFDADDPQQAYIMAAAHLQQPILARA